MPVNVERLEPMIYINTWQAPLAIADIERGWMHQSHMAMVEREDAYVAIVEVDVEAEIPADVRALGKTLKFDSKCIHIVFVGVQPAMRMFFDTLGKASRKTNQFTIVDALDSAVKHARLILREHRHFPNNDDETTDGTKI